MQASREEGQQTLSALNCFITDSAYYLYTDGATYDESTGGHVMGVASKVFALPQYNAVVGFVGVGWSNVMLYVHLGEKRFSGFDDLREAFAGQVRETVIRSAEQPQMRDWGPTSMVLMGWSEKSNRPAATIVDVYDSAHGKAFTPRDITDLRHPVADGFSFDPQHAERDGLALMEAQRRMELQAVLNPAWVGHYVGGFCQQTVVTAEGIFTRNLKTWPDRIGKVINPKRDDDDMMTAGPGWKERLRENRTDD